MNFAVIITILALLRILSFAFLDFQSHLPRCTFNHPGWERLADCVPTVGAFHKTLVSDKQGDCAFRADTF